MTRLISVAVSFLFIVSCNNDKTASNSPDAKISSEAGAMTQERREEQNKGIALTCIKAWSNGNIDEIVKHLALNTADLGDESTPPARGIDSVKYFMQLWNSSVDNYKSDNELAVADGDYVFVYAGWSGTFREDFMGMITTGKSFKFKDVDIFKFDGESKITEHRAVHFSTVLKQFASQ